MLAWTGGSRTDFDDDGFLIIFSFIFCYFWHQIHKFFLLLNSVRLWLYRKWRKNEDFSWKNLRKLLLRTIQKLFYFLFKRNVSATCDSSLFLNLQATTKWLIVKKKRIYELNDVENKCVTIYVHSMGAIWWSSFEPVLFVWKYNKRFSNSFIFCFEN